MIFNGTKCLSESSNYANRFTNFLRLIYYFQVKLFSHWELMSIPTVTKSKSKFLRSRGMNQWMNNGRKVLDLVDSSAFYHHG